MTTMPTNLKELCGDRYRITDDGTDDSDRAERVWCQEIRGRHGAVYPFGWDGTLAVRVDSVRIAARIQSLGLRVVQSGDYEIVFVFAVTQLDQIAALIRARKRRHLSPEAKAKAIARLNAMAAAKKQGVSFDSQGASGD